MTCNRERIPPWLLDVHGCAVVPGSIVKCSRGSARYVPPPSGLPPGAPGTTTPPRNKSRSPPKSPQPASPRTPRAGASSGTTTLPGSPGRSTGAIGRRYPATRQNPSPSPSPVRSGRRGIADNNRRSGAVSPANSLSTRNAASPTAAAAADVVVPTSPQQPRRTAYSPKPNKTANKNSATSPGGGDVRSPRREKKGRAEVAFEAVTAAIKRNFEAQPGDRMVMVVGVNGFRPQSTRAPPRSVEGYCIVVRSRLVCWWAFLMGLPYWMFAHPRRSFASQVTICWRALLSNNSYIVSAGFVISCRKSTCAGGRRCMRHSAI